MFKITTEQATYYQFSSKHTLNALNPWILC